MFLLSLVLFLVALGLQVPLTTAFHFNFSIVQQCAPVQLSFFGLANATSAPTTLLLLPFNSTPFSIPLPNITTDGDTGATVSFFPLPEGTEFVASLDNDSGDGTAKVSDVFRVQPSPTNDTSCLPSPSAVSTALFTLPTAVSQCAPFSIAYRDAAPSVRAFLPDIGSFPIDILQDDTKENTAIYTLNAARGFPIVLMAFPANDTDAGMVTPLLTIGGDTSSNQSCLVTPNKSVQMSSTKPSPKPTLSIGLIVGVSVGGGVLVAIAIGLLVYFLRRCCRRRRRRAAAMAFDPSLLEKQPSSSQASFVQRSDFIRPREYKHYKHSLMSYSRGSKADLPSLRYSENSESGFVKDPPYTTEKYSPTDADFHAETVSWVVVDRERETARRDTVRSDNSSVNPYDIERMLDVAARHQSDLINNVAQSSMDQLLPSGRHLRNPSDVPAGPNSMIVSPNILGPGATIYESPKSSHFSTMSGDFEIITRPQNVLQSPPFR